MSALPADRYARSGERWALGAELVYGPIAADLVAASPRPLAGQVVLPTRSQYGRCRPSAE